MSQNGRQPFRPFEPSFGMSFGPLNDQIGSMLINNRLNSARVPSQTTNFRKRRSEDMENQEYKPRSVSSTENVIIYNFFESSLGCPSPSVSEIQQVVSKHLLGQNGSWDLCAPVPTNVNAIHNIPSQNNQCNSIRVPELFHDHGFWQKYQATSTNVNQGNYVYGTSTRQNQKMLFSPLPLIDWADRADLWENMLRKDVSYARSTTCLSRHPSIQPKMRSILLSWLTEVCEVYKLHRETYYLATDFLDRFLAASKQEIIKNNLQLVGITALFIAAKIEEIYPPKVKEFAYVTDGACLVEEIKRMEVIILTTLDWQLCPLTTIGWLSTYLQVAYLSDISNRELTSLEMVRPKYSHYFFTSIAQILDLCVLDLESLRFPSSHLAAAALYHMSSASIVKAASGFSVEVLLPCIKWMQPYVDVLFERGFAEQHFFEGICLEEQHTIQQHSVDQEILEKVQKKVAERYRSQVPRDVFVNLHQRQWLSIVESPMRSAMQQQMPLTPLCTPPDFSPPSTNSDFSSGSDRTLTYHAPAPGDIMLDDMFSHGFHCQ